MQPWHKSRSSPRVIAGVLGLHQEFGGLLAQQLLETTGELADQKAPARKQAKRATQSPTTGARGQVGEIPEREAVPMTGSLAPSTCADVSDIDSKNLRLTTGRHTRRVTTKALISQAQPTALIDHGHHDLPTAR